MTAFVMVTWSAILAALASDETPIPLVKYAENMFRPLPKDELRQLLVAIKKHHDAGEEGPRWANWLIRKVYVQFRFGRRPVFWWEHVKAMRILAAQTWSSDMPCPFSRGLPIEELKGDNPLVKRSPRAQRQLNSVAQKRRHSETRAANAENRQRHAASVAAKRAALNEAKIADVALAEAIRPVRYGDR